ncbi:MAG: phosphoglucomutase [Elusimicrobiaceae bacterium]|nr:phosphoglucomutase [Elusimicrobiaceae bacterium]
MVHPKAGTLSEEKIDLEILRKNFFEPKGDISKVKFGTSGHRGSLGQGFCAKHAEAIAQAVATLHKEEGLLGKILVGGDTRLMSKTTAEICAQVLSANGLKVVLPSIAVPTPVFSFEILSGRVCAALNGTASHNPPQDMGLKYNPSNGGPASSVLTKKIEELANYYLENPQKIQKISLEEARKKGLVEDCDIITPYVKALGKKINFDIIGKSSLKVAITPLGGASLPFYKEIIKRYKLKNVELVLSEQNPDFHFIPLDHDGKIRMDPSSVYPMKPLIELAKNGDYDFVGASDPDGDRFGCVTRKGGLIAPNHALCVMLDYMARKSSKEAPKKVGRTLGTTMLMDKIAKNYGLGIEEVNVGFKYFVDGLLNKELLMAGEESAGMSITDWVTEKDGILAVCLLLEIMCFTGQDIAGLYEQLTALYGKSYYTRVDSPAQPEIKEKFKNLKAENFAELKTFAGQEILHVRDTDGIKIYLKDSWLLARASGTENIIKLYAETFKSQEYLDTLISSGKELFAL